MKARSAIGLAGHGGDVVVWFDTRGGFATSTAVSRATPAASCRSTSTRNPVTAAYGHSGNGCYDPALYQNKDDNPSEKAPTGWTRTFPHIIGSKSGKPDGEFYSHWMGSPFSDEYLGKLAAHAVDDDAAREGQRRRFSRRELLGARSRRTRLRSEQPRSAGPGRAARRDDRRAVESSRRVGGRGQLRPGVQRRPRRRRDPGGGPRRALHRDDHVGRGRKGDRAVHGTRRSTWRMSPTPTSTWRSRH